MTNALALLKAVRARLDRPEAWCQGADARDRRGRGVSVYAARAVAWSVRGAAWVETDPMSPSPTPVLSAALGFASIPAMIIWNDAPDRTHADIIARLDESIEKQEAPNA